MSLYPSLDQLNLHSEVIPVPKNEKTEIKSEAKSVYNNGSLLPVNLNYKSLYPVLSEYMGLDISKSSELRKNDVVKSEYFNSSTIKIPDVPGQVTNGLRRLTLCKDSEKRVGLLTSAINQGIFVCFVLKDSPAALGGLRFGDQILQINDTLLAGFTADKVHDLIKKCPVNNINFIIRDRPFERTVTMQKDNAGRVGFEFKHGKIVALVKDSSAARNGLVTDHHLLEIQGQNVIGMNDKEITKLMENGGPVVTVTIIPSFLYEQMMKKMRADYIKAKMDHSAHV